MPPPEASGRRGPVQGPRVLDEAFFEMATPGGSEPSDSRLAGAASSDLIAEALSRCELETIYGAPESVRRRVLSVASAATLNDAALYLARVRFESHRFDFVPVGAWALIAPITECGGIVDLAAFDLDGMAARPYALSHVAVNIEDAVADARLHPNGRLLVAPDVWSWLRGECVGLLPIDWGGTALLLKDLGVPLVCADRNQGLEVARRLREALALPSIFIREDDRAAEAAA